MANRPRRDLPTERRQLLYLGHLVRQLIVARDLRVPSVAEALGVSHQTLYRLQAGGGITAQKLPSLARYFGLSLDTLFGLDRDLAAVPDADIVLYAAHVAAQLVALGTED